MQDDEKNRIAGNWVDEALKTPPVIKISDKFAEQVAAKAIRRFAWQQYIREFFIYLGTFLGFIAVTVALAFIFLGAEWLEWKQFLVENWSLVASLNIIGLFVLFADKVLLQYFFFKYTRRLYR